MLRTGLVPSVLVISAAFVSGCAHHHAASIPGPDIDAESEAALRRLAARELGCAPEALTLQYKETLAPNLHVYQAEGCRKHFQALLRCFPGFYWNWYELPDRRAAFDLQCQIPNAVTHQYLGNMTFGLSGCGRAITYVYDERNGRWMANTATTTP